MTGHPNTMAGAILRPGQVALLDQIDDVIAGGCEAPAQNLQAFRVSKFGLAFETAVVVAALAWEITR